MRVAFVLRSAEVQPLFRDLCDALCLDETFSSLHITRSLISPP